MTQGDSSPVVAARFQKLLEAAPDAILEVDKDGRILLINEQTEQMFGWPREELLGQRIESLIPPRFHSAHIRHRSGYEMQPSRRPMGTGLDLWAVRRDGTEFAVDINLSPVVAEDGPHVICIVRDVTERNLAEERIRTLNQNLELRGAQLALANDELALRNREVERANQLKSEFLASMSHELRTPLNAIIGFSDLLAEQSAGSLNAKQHRYVGHIQQGAQHLLTLINDVLDLSKIEAGQLELRRETFGVPSVVAEAISTVKPLAEGKKIRLETGFLSEDVSIYADRVRVKQILYNLLSNAIKFTPDHGRVWVEFTMTGSKISVAVCDTGVGIAEEHHESIFDSFRQFGPSTKGVREGTGLGLAITKRLVEQHSGTIRLTSAPGSGSRFEFTLPLQATAPARDVFLAPGQRDKLMILVVDDNPSAGELLVNHLESAGYSTHRAATGIEAVRMARELQPDVITLDILMPQLSGWEALHQLKNTPECAAIPTIIVSVVDQQKMGFALGASEYLMKPVTKEALLEAVRRCLQAT